MTVRIRLRDPSWVVDEPSPLRAWLRRRWARIRYHRITLAVACTIHGHDNGERRWTRCAATVSCDRCGHLQGIRYLTGECRFYCRCRTQRKDNPA